MTGGKLSYRDFLKVVGHLFKSEHASAGAAELTAALQDARKRFQISGTVPDWDAICKLIETEKKKGKQ